MENSILFERLCSDDIEVSSEARTEIIESNLRLARSIARSFVSDYHNVCIDDLIQEASIALMYAVDKFDVERQVQFSTFATIHIKRYLRYYIQTQISMIYVPPYILDNLYKIGLAQKRFEEEIGRLPTEQELAIELDVHIDRIKMLLKYKSIPEIYSLNASISTDDENETELIETIADDSIVSQYDVMESEELHTCLVDIFMSMPEDLREVLILRFDVDCRFHYLLDDDMREKANDILFSRHKKKGAHKNHLTAYECIGDITDISRQAVQLRLEKAVKVFRRKIRGCEIDLSGFIGSV